MPQSGQLEKQKKTEENKRKHFTFQWKIEQKKTLFPDKRNETRFYLFLFVFICFFFVRTYGAIPFKNLKNNFL